MTQIQSATESTHTSRRAPNPHSEAVQEAKRLEKMQSVCSSHRTHGTAAHPSVPTGDVAH